VTVLTPQLGEITGIIATIIGIKIDLCIFYKKKRNKIQDRVTNTDENLILVTINKVIPYRNLEKVRQFYNIND
jgi:hypothetical protein